jgi:hypothetical protein
LAPPDRSSEYSETRGRRATPQALIVAAGSHATSPSAFRRRYSPGGAGMNVSSGSLRPVPPDSKVGFRRYPAIPAHIGQGLKSHPQATFGGGDFALIGNYAT